MKLAAVIMLLALTGCASPNVMKWPDAPEELKQPAAELSVLREDQHQLSDLIQNANENYSKYYQLKNKYEAWQDWYNKQQKIYNDAADKIK